MDGNTYRELSPREMEDFGARILYEDNHILIVNKKPGEIVQGDKTGDEPIGDLCKAYLARRDNKPGRVFIGIPHRLDRPVSGAVILAKTSKALERLAGMFRTGDIHKTYWALTCSAPEQHAGELDDYLVRNEKLNKSFVVNKETKDAKLAKLTYTLLGKTRSYWLLEVNLLTGRHHQIRCQLAHMGCVIKGDLKYGAPRSNQDGGICLHARKIEFIHPVRKTPMCVTAPVPETWKGVGEITL